MFKMNPHAKEFIPASILRKRKEQEEAEKLAKLTNDLGKVDINEGKENVNTDDGKNINNDVEKKRGSQEKDNDDTIKDNSVKQSETTPASDSTKSSTNQKNNKSTNPNSNNNCSNPNSGDAFNDYYYPDDEDYGDDDYLEPGENVCEFEGEQWIVPNDFGEHENPGNVGYDFGNEEDNEDEEVRKAFEEFLGDLPQ